MKALLDTCILSELRLAHNMTILKSTLDLFNASDLYISVVSIGEIFKGIGLLPASRKKMELQQWAHQLETNYRDRILPIDSDIAHTWGDLTAHAQTQGKIIPIADGLIAATALVHGLQVMTRNTADFEYTGVLLINPWA